MTGRSKGISLNYMAGYYDLLTHGEKSRFRRNQVGLIGIREGESILDVGCGTGVLTVMAKKAAGPSARVEGIDIAPRMIAQSQRKARRLGLDVRFQTASIDELPFEDGSFDVVSSSLMFHHLSVAMKRRGSAEIHRVLRSGGRLFLCDFGRPRRLVFPLSWLMLVWLESTRFQLEGRLPDLLTEHGFSHVEMVMKGAFLDYLLAWKD